MKVNNLKPKQKLLSFNKFNLSVHKDAEKALAVWQRCRPLMAYVNLQELDKFYRPPLRLVLDKQGHYCFINDFNRVYQILRFEESISHLCLITPEHSQDIRRLAWSDVLQLCHLANIHHPDLYNDLKKSAPKEIICELMGLSELSIKTYCQFAGISQHHYEYQQYRTANEEGMIGLPTSMNWLSEVS